MVDFRKENRGENAMKGVNAVIRTFSNSAKEKDGSVTGQYLDVQLDSRDHRAFSSRVNPETGRKRKTADNPDLHFVSRRSPGVNGGKPKTDNGHFYYASQVDAMIAQAKADGNYHERTVMESPDNPKLDKNGKPVVESVFGVKADATIVQAAKSGAKAVILNTRTLESSDFKVGPDVIKYQIDAMKTARKNLDNEKKAAEAEKSTEKETSQEAAPAEKAKTSRAKSGSTIKAKDSAPSVDAEAPQAQAEGGEFA